MTVTETDASDSARPAATGRLRVLWFCVVLVVACGALSALPGSPVFAPSWWIAALVFALYTASELRSIEIEFRNETHAFSFTSVPLVIGVLLLPVQLLVLLRVVSSLVVLAAVHRQASIKLIVNLTSHALEVLIAGQIARWVGIPVGLGVPAWPATALALVAADLAGALVITVAISLYQGQWDRSLLAGVWLPLLIALVDSSFALLAATELAARSTNAWLIAPVGILTILLAHRLARLTNRYRSMIRLDGFAQELGRDVLDSNFESLLLSRVADVMHADHAWLWRVADSHGTKVLYSRVSGSTTPGIPSPFDVGALALLDNGPQLFNGSKPYSIELGASGLSEAVLGRLQVGDGEPIVVGVGDRTSAVRGFDAEDVLIFGTLCAHAAVSIRNVELLGELRAESASLEHQATHDPLTNLPNRTYFKRHLEGLPGLTRDWAVLLIDLDRFKEVNDTLGHACGDQLLVDVGRRLKPLLSADELFARLGGDEFVLAIQAGSERDAVARSREILDRIRSPYTVESVDVDVDASIGVALMDDGLGVNELLRRADVAMYNAKTHHTEIEVYSADRDHYSPKRLALAARLRSAIDDDQIRLHYQPQIDLATGEVVGVEALARWHDPSHGEVPPQDFIEIAERTDLIHPLTARIIQMAIEQAACWYRSGNPVRVAVNISARNLTEVDLVSRIRSLLASRSLPGHLIEIELTETAIMANTTLANTLIAQLRAMNVLIAVDDFGTGHSSLGQLTSLSVDKLKIDRSFTQAIGSDPTAETIVRAIVDLGRNLNMHVIAEGVETPLAQTMLSEMGCKLGQGYLYGRPMPAPEFERWLFRYVDAGRQHPASAPVS